MIAKLFRKLLGIKEPKKPAAPVAKARLETLIRAESQVSRSHRASVGSGRRRDTGGESNDLLNPLNPLSPLSPISPFNSLNQVDEPSIRQRVEDDAVSRAGHHDHRGFMGADAGRQAAPTVHNQRHEHSRDDSYRHGHSVNDDGGRHSHSYGGSHSHSSYDSGSSDSGSSDSGGGGGGSD